MKALPDMGHETHPLSLTNFFLGPYSRLSQECCPLESLHDLKVNRAGQYLLLNPGPAVPGHNLLGELAELC